MLQAENNLPGEQLQSLSILNGKFSLDDIDPAWGGRNEQFDEDMPVAGYIQYVMVKRHHLLGDYLEMRTIFVDKSQRNKGVGRKLFEALERIALKNGIKRIVVKVVCSKDDANAFCYFLPALGYTELPTTDYDFDWEKRL